ncbi:MAG: FMN-binding protein [Treponema sp.]|nr:FMN-binding protein [Treponema sp.]
MGIKRSSFFLSAALLTAPLLWGCAGASGARADRGFSRPSPGDLPDGEYEGSGRGYRGTIRVRVRIEAGEIAEILVTGSEEDPSVGGAALEELLELALVYQSTDLDAVSGATESSKGFLAALEDAILSP